MGEGEGVDLGLVKRVYISNIWTSAEGLYLTEFAPCVLFTSPRKKQMFAQMLVNGMQIITAIQPLSLKYLSDLTSQLRNLSIHSCTHQGDLHNTKYTNCSSCELQSFRLFKILLIFSSVWSDLTFHIQHNKNKTHSVYLQNIWSIVCTYLCCHHFKHSSLQYHLVHECRIWNSWTWELSVFREKEFHAKL